MPMIRKISKAFIQFNEINYLKVPKVSLYGGSIIKTNGYSSSK